jgi:hypothetical protein
LQDYLLSELPQLGSWLASAIAEHGGEPTSEYWLFSFVVRPYLLGLLNAGDDTRLEKAWQVLEQIAATGTPPERNELLVMTEELELHRFYRFMGQRLRSHWLEALVWYPTLRTRSEPMNEHVDRGRLQARWLEEIERVGGFERLSEELSNQIAADLWAEFRVERV